MTDPLRNRVFVIRIAKGKQYEGQIVGVVEGPPPAALLSNEEAAGVVRLWTHRSGLSPEAAHNFEAVEVPDVVKWVDLLGASRPIEPTHGSLSRVQIVELMDRLRYLGGNQPRTDAQWAEDRAEAAGIRRRLNVTDYEAAVERYGDPRLA